MRDSVHAFHLSVKLAKLDDLELADFNRTIPGEKSVVRAVTVRHRLAIPRDEIIARD